MFARKTLISAAASGVFVLLVSFAGAQHVPLYDGIGYPDEPYRYAVKAGVKEPDYPPTGINFTAKKDQPSGNSISVSSNEQGPQVMLVIGKQSLAFPARSTEYTIKVEPSPALTQPENGSYQGNIYNFEVSSDAGKVPFTPSTMSTISLRLPKNNGFTPTIEYSKDGVSWERLITTQTGNDVYAALLAGYGKYVLFSSQITPKPHNNSGRIVAGISVGGTLLVLVLVLRRKAPAAKA